MTKLVSHARTDAVVTQSPVTPQRLTASPTPASESGTQPLEAPAITTGVRSLRPRWSLFDGLRGIAAQIIVWHHFVSYGPVVDSASVIAPVVVDLLFDYGRMVVHLFLVIGGYVAAEAVLARGTESWQAAGLQLGRRFLRLSVPYWIVLILAIGANACADRWIDDPMISGPPSLASLAAHGLLLFNCFGFRKPECGDLVPRD